MPDTEGPRFQRDWSSLHVWTVGLSGARRTAETAPPMLQPSYELHSAQFSPAEGARPLDRSLARLMRPDGMKYTFGTFPTDVISGRFRVRVAFNPIGAAMAGNSSMYGWMG